LATLEVAKFAAVLIGDRSRKQLQKELSSAGSTDSELLLPGVTELVALSLNFSFAMDARNNSLELIANE